MNNSVFLESVYSKVDTNIHIKKDVNVEEILNIQLKNVRSGNSTRIELNNFYDHFDIYQELQQKKQALKEQLKNIPPSTKEYIPLQTQLQQLHAQETEMRTHILDLALMLNKMKDTEKISAVKSAYEKGQLKAIDGLISDDYLEQQLTTLEQKKEKIAAKLMDSANEFNIKARITYLLFDVEENERFKKVLYFYDTGLKSASKTHNNEFHVEYLRSYCLFTDSLHLIDKTEQLYEQLDAISHEWGTTLNKAAFLQQRNKLDQALRAMQFLLVDIRHGRYPDLKPNELATIHNNAGNLYRSLAEYDTAIKQLLKAESYFTDLAPTPSNINLYVSIMTNLSLCYALTENYQEAIKIAEKSLQIKQQFLTVDETYTKRSIALTQSNLGKLYLQIKDFATSEFYHLESLKNINFCVQKDANIYLPFYAINLFNMTQLFYAKKDLDHALKYGIECFDIRQRYFVTARLPQNEFIEIGDLLFSLLRDIIAKDETQTNLAALEAHLLNRKNMANIMLPLHESKFIIDHLIANLDVAIFYTNQKPELTKASEAMQICQQDFQLIMKKYLFQVPQNLLMQLQNVYFRLEKIHAEKSGSQTN